MTPEAARAIAEQKIGQFLGVQEANSQTLATIIEPGNPEAAFQKLVGQTADRLGVPGLANLLDDATSPTYAAFERINKATLPANQPTDLQTLQSSAEYRLEKFMIGEAVDGGHVAGMRQLPDDPRLAVALGGAAIGRIFDDRNPQLAGQRPDLEALLNRELPRLAEIGPAEKAAADQLLRSLQGVTDRIANPGLKLKVLEAARDENLAAARQGGTDKNWADAAAFQNDIIALHLERLGALLTAQRKDALAALAASSPELKEAMTELDQLERAYITAKGADPDQVRLDWREGRDQLARVRGAAQRLVGEAEGNELQAFIAAGMRAITAGMIEKAVAVLGPPPAEFTAVSLGSASRGEASPFSDVEFAILLDRPSTPQSQAYFQELASLVRFQVANLGEDGGKVTPAGFHWDTGGNSPVENPTAFIGSAAELIRANLGEAEGGAPSAMFEMTMLTSPEFLYGSQGGDNDFARLQDLQAKVQQHLQQDSTEVPGLSRSQAFGRWLAGMANELGNLRQAVQEEVVDVKKISRLPMMLVQSLALEHGVANDATGSAANSTTMRLGALRDAGVLSQADVDTLGNAFATLGRVRMEAHLHAGWADDRVHLDPAKAGSAFAAPELRQVITDMLPFVDRIERHAADPSRPF